MRRGIDGPFHLQQTANGAIATRTDNDKLRCSPCVGLHGVRNVKFVFQHNLDAPRHQGYKPTGCEHVRRGAAKLCVDFFNPLGNIRRRDFFFPFHLKNPLPPKLFRAARDAYPWYAVSSHTLNNQHNHRVHPVAHR